MIPTCEILHTTAPSAWTSNSLMSMSSSAFSNCLELMGRDPFLASYQRSQVLKRVKEVRCICVHIISSQMWFMFWQYRVKPPPRSSLVLILSICSVSEDIRHSLILFPVCDLSAGRSSDRAVSGGAEQPPIDRAEEHRCYGSCQHLEQQTGIT